MSQREQTSSSSEDDFHSVQDWNEDDQSPSEGNVLSSSGQDKQPTLSTAKRRKRRCHLCGASVYNMARHLESRPHSLTKAMARREVALRHPRRRRRFPLRLPPHQMRRNSDQFRTRSSGQYSYIQTSTRSFLVCACVSHLVFMLLFRQSQ